MAIAEVQGDPIRATAFSGTAAPTLAYSVAVTAGNHLAVGIMLEPGTTVTSVTDSVNGAWTQTGFRDGTTGNVYWYHKASTGAGTPTVTVNLSTGSTGGSFAIFEFSVADTFSVGNTAGNGAANGIANAGNIQVDVASTILLSAVEGNGGDQTAGASYTLLNPANGWGFETIQYRIVSSTGNYSTAFGTDHGAAWDALAVSYSVEALTPPSAVLSGTVTDPTTEADIVAGGKTVILTVANDTLVPASVTQTIGYIANALGGTTDTTSFSITLPTTQAGDILLLEFCHRGTGDGTIGGTSITTGGLTWTLKHSQLFSSSTFSGKLYWTRATGNHSGQTVTGSGLTDSCAAILTQYRNVVGSGDPFTGAATIVGEENASGNETQAQITTLVDGCMVCLTVLNSPDLAVSTQSSTSPGALTERAERLSTGGTDASIAHASELKATAGGTGALTWAQTNAASGSYAYALQPAVTTPFADARAAIASGLDSAQSEAAGWDAKVKPNIPVANVVRTSDTVITVTLQAQSDYDITATETITATIPATALTLAGAVVATPTFTINPYVPTTGGYQLNYHR